MPVTYQQVKVAFRAWGEERTKAVDMLLKLSAVRTPAEWAAYRAQSERADAAHTRYNVLSAAYRNSGFDNETPQEVVMEYEIYLMDEHSESNDDDSETVELDNLQVDGEGDLSSGGDLAGLGWL